MPHIKIPQSSSSNCKYWLQWYFSQTLLKLLLKVNPYISLNLQVKKPNTVFSKQYQKNLKFYPGIITQLSEKKVLHQFVSSILVSIKKKKTTKKTTFPNILFYRKHQVKRQYFLSFHLHRITRNKDLMKINGRRRKLFYLRSEGKVKLKKFQEVQKVQIIEYLQLCGN